MRSKIDFTTSYGGSYLDEKYARENYHLRVSCQDKWYTYLDIVPERQKSTRSWRANLDRCRAVLMNKDGDGVPADMPRQLWYQGADGFEFTFDIRSWKANPADGPKAEEFTRPEDRPGWEVSEPRPFPWWGAKRSEQPKAPARKLGCIYIVGNDITYQSAFLDRLGLYCGSPFTEADLRAAERRLRLLRLLGISCSVSAMDREGDSEYSLTVPKGYAALV